jgi:hypothetical protein
MTARHLALLALLAPAAILAAPAPASRPARPGATGGAAPSRPVARTSAADASSGGGLEVGGFVGYETADFSGPSLRLDGELPVRQLSRQLRLSAIGSVGYSHLTWSPGLDVKGTADVVKLVPALRLMLPVARSFSVFGDAGVGLAYVSARIGLPASFGAASFGDSTVNLMFRIAPEPGTTRRIA